MPVGLIGHVDLNRYGSVIRYDPVSQQMNEVLFECLEEYSQVFGTFKEIPSYSIGTKGTEDTTRRRLSCLAR